MNLRRELDGRLTEALSAVCGREAPALVAAASRPQFGDYQANGVMAAAKQTKADPRKLAEQVLAAADLSDLAEKVQIAGPGFVNITLRADWLASQLTKQEADGTFAVKAPDKPQTVVVDYSCPNLAKEMHVGHLRSTIIGDALARVLEFIGHKVERQNHVGDWGTQFGMLIACMDGRTTELSPSGDHAVQHVQLGDLEEFYQEARQRFESDPQFARTSREYVVKLQAGDRDVWGKWSAYRATSLLHCQKVYDRLGVLLTPDDVKGESQYNADLPDVVADLDKRGILTESQGAKCVFPDEFTNKDGDPLPVIVQKSDGGYLYATTDLAAIRYRVGTLKANRVLYVTDARQSLHFQQIFAVAREGGFAEAVSLEHIAFGTMMGADGRPFKTREGGTVKLMDLLDEAESRALGLVSEKNPDLPDEAKKQIAHAVGIGAVKYADLSQNRTSDYVFSWDKMLSLEGNTAPYMQYAYARIRSIFRKGGLSETAASGKIEITEPPERALAVKLMQFPETVEAVAAECLPNILCGYLFALAGAFMGFYENCPVLQSDEPVRTARLMLCQLTARTMKCGLHLLGIETIEQM